MGRIPPLVASSLGLLFAPAAWAGPPALPEGDPATAPAEAAPAEAPPAEPTPTEPAPTDAAPAEAGGSVSGSADLSAEIGDAGLGGDASGDASGDAEGRRGRKRGKRGKDDASAATESDDPGMVRGRREPMMNTNRGAAGLFTTALPDVGGKYTFRFKLYTDFFRREGFIYVGSAGPDQHSRVRGGVALAFSPFEWGEVFMSVNSQANRNAREQPGRQDAEAIFALGDVDFGLKGAYRFKGKAKGIGVGGQVGVGLLSGSDRLLTSGVNAWFDGLFAVDVRYLTKKHFPFRFTTNIGWMYDSSLKIAPFGRISDDVSREVTRFALGANHSRMRMKYAVDFPIRLGKERQFGIDPILEWSWDVSTQQEDAFGRDDAVPSPLPRSSQWLTLGIRANVISGLHLEAAADIGMVSPSFEFGPPVPPWQVLLGLGWSFDPTPIVKEVEVPTEAPPPAPAPAPVEGRIVGTVVDPAGAPIPEARVVFPGLTTTTLLTDANGSFTSFRFPAGQVPVQVILDGQVVAESTADIANGQDTSLTIQLQAMPTPPSGVVQGAVTDASGAAVQFSMRVVGQGVDQTFDSTPGGLIALQLPVGEYSGTITAPGYKTKTTSFTVPAGGELQVTETLEADKPPETPKVSGSKKGIRLKGGIKYDGEDVSRKSHDLLDQLATFLNAHPEFKLVQINVHTDNEGNPGRRSQARADAVKDYLVGKGVSSSRIVAKGHGDSSPVAVNLTPQGRAKNNRTSISVKDYGK